MATCAIPFLQGGRLWGFEISYSNLILHSITSNEYAFFKSPFHQENTKLLAEYLTPVVFFGSILLVIATLLLTAAAIISKLRTEKHSIAHAYHAIQSESDLLRARLEIQEHALNTIYYEIHENIGQMLSGVHMKLVTMGFSTDNTQHSGHLSELATYMRRSIEDLRNLGHAVNGTAIEKTGLIDALEKEIVFASSVYDLQCIFTCEDELPELTNMQDTILFRIIQGMIGYMFGISRGSTGVMLNISYTRDTLDVSIANNDPGSMPQGSDIADLPQSIADRIKLLKGSIFMTNQTQKGTVLTFTCNLNHVHNI